jgi:hypothetical protein
VLIDRRAGFDHAVHVGYSHAQFALATGHALSDLDLIEIK